MRCETASISVSRAPRVEIASGRRRLAWLGKLHQTLGFDDEAMNCFQQTWSVFRQFGLPLEEARTLKDIGTLHASRGDHTAAEAAWRQALIIFVTLTCPKLLGYKLGYSHDSSASRHNEQQIEEWPSTSQ
jgi:tetratricopeptide (TPR) repeat protein